MNEEILAFANSTKAQAIYPNITALYLQRLENAALAMEALKMAEDTLKMLMEKK